MIPSRRDDSRFRSSLDTRRIFSEDDSETLTEMPVDVTVKNPWTRVVSFESESYVAGVDGYYVSAGWVYVVWSSLTCGFDDVECVLHMSFLSV